MVMTVGIDDSEQGQLDFLAAHYGFAVKYMNSWDLFSEPFARAAVTHVVVCGVDDSPLALHAALTAASVHGAAAATCVSKGDRTKILGLGLQLAEDISGVFPDTAGAASSVNKWVLKRQREDRHAAGNLSTSIFATWSSNTNTKSPTSGYDFVTYSRLLTMCLDSQAADFDTTQTSILQSFAANQSSMALGFGWWTDEGKDIDALSTLGLSWLGGGRNLALFSSLPSMIPGTQQPVGSLPEVPAGASVAVISFTQGDAESFNQKINQRILRQPSVVVSVTVSDNQALSPNASWRHRFMLIFVNALASC
jgi:hypothetical protein